MRALVIGGTGPTGPSIVRGLLERGYEVAILHRGTHEIDDPYLSEVEHIHADPHFADSISEALGGRTYDLVVATYGRIRLFIDVFSQRTDRFVAVGGSAYAHPSSAPVIESSPRDQSHALYQKMFATEDALMKAHRDGIFNVTLFRYPNLYGPRQLAPREWSVIRRILDGRRRLVVLDGALTMESRAFAEHAAHAVLLSVDEPVKSSGEIYNVADETTPTDSERISAIAEAMGAEVTLVSLPPAAGLPAWYWGSGRSLTWGEDVPPPTGHRLISVEKIRADLGYRDLYPFPDAMSRTVDWYLANPPESGGESEVQLGDSFDYAGEDRFLAASDLFVEECQTIPFTRIGFRHQYDHPQPTRPSPDGPVSAAARTREVGA